MQSMVGGYTKDSTKLGGRWPLPLKRALTCLGQYGVRTFYDDSDSRFRPTHSSAIYIHVLLEP